MIRARSSVVFRTLALALASWAAACGPAGEASVPSHEVKVQPFRHRVTAEGRLQSTQTTKLSVPSQVDRAVRLAWLAPEGTRLAAGDVVARFDPQPMQEKLDDGERELRSSSLEIERKEIENEAKLEDLKKDLKVAEIELEHAQAFQKDDAQVFSRRDIQEDAIDQYLAADRKAFAETSAETRRSLARTERELLEIKKRRALQNIELAERGLEALEITAPHDGVLTLARTWRGDPIWVGLEMWRGQEVGEIPDLSQMEALVYVLEADAGGLAEGKPAEVVIEAHPDRVYPAVIRSVEAVAKPRFRGSPVQYFGVVLAFESTDLEVMKPGGRVRATLFLEDRPEAVVVPRQAVFQAGSEARVYVRRNAGFEPRAVKVGPTSLGSVVIESGLEPGEVVALAEPPEAEAETDEDAGAAVDDGRDSAPAEPSPEATAARAGESP